MLSERLLSGLTVYSDACIPETKETHRQERKWAHRCMWRRHQRFTIKTAPVVIKMGDKLFAHPATVEKLQSRIIAGHQK